MRQYPPSSDSRCMRLKSRRCVRNSVWRYTDSSGGGWVETRTDADTGDAGGLALTCAGLVVWNESMTDTAREQTRSSRVSDCFGLNMSTTLPQ